MTSTIQAGKDIAGDGSGYTNSSILQSVIAWNEEDAQWYLDLRNSQNTRMVHLNFTGNGIAGTGPDEWDSRQSGIGPYKVWMYTPCNTGNYNVNLLDDADSTRRRRVPWLSGSRPVARGTSCA